MLVVEELGSYSAPVSYSNTVSTSIELEAAPMASVEMPVQADEMSITASIKVTFAIE